MQEGLEYTPPPHTHTPFNFDNHWQYSNAPQGVHSIQELSVCENLSASNKGGLLTKHWFKCEHDTQS